MARQQAIWKNTVIAESDRTVVVDGHHYFPTDSVRREFLEPSGTHTRCGWKGTASYFDVVVDGQHNRDAAWYYPDPSTAARHIAGHIAFWHGVTVRRGRDDGAREEPAGRQRGGWLRTLLGSRRHNHPATRGINHVTKPIAVTDSDFDTQIRRSERPALVDFWASWCAPCRVMEPVVDELAAKYTGVVTVAKLDVDANPASAQEFGVRSVPTLILFDHGKPVQRLVGVQDKELLEGLVDGTLVAHGSERP